MYKMDWLGVDIEHTSKYAYHGMICLIQITVYYVDEDSFTAYLIDTLELSKKEIRDELGIFIL